MLSMSGGIPQLPLYAFMVWCLIERWDSFVTAGRRRWRTQCFGMLAAVFRERSVVKCTRFGLANKVSLPMPL